MRIRVVMIVACMVVFTIAMASAQGEKKGNVSFKSDVFPIIKAKCLPCHAEDNFNPSELSMDSYDLLTKGGKHGAPFKVGKSGESLIIQKLSEEPPFGDRMPLNSKRKIQEGRAVWLTADEAKAVATWIDQGAKNN
jgi:hypothetical protein